MPAGKPNTLIKNFCEISQSQMCLSYCFLPNINTFVNIIYRNFPQLIPQTNI